MIPVTRVEDNFTITVDSSDATIIETGSVTYVVEAVEEVTGISITESQQDIIEVSDHIFVEAPVLTKRIDFVSESEFYKGEALPGTSESSSAWRISFTVIGNDDDVSEKWANGNSNFDKAWVDRLVLTYL